MFKSKFLKGTFKLKRKRNFKIGSLKVTLKSKCKRNFKTGYLKELSHRQLKGTLTSEFKSHVTIEI